MRLLNVTTLKLEWYESHCAPKYSILSHTWGDEEVTFQDLTRGTFSHLQGASKVLQCARLTKREGLTHTWIDTCCIDKSSSSELSEAINSMFAWYQRAAFCYAILSDVDGLAPGDDVPTSRWFTRGWTLQELIAPGMVVFLNARWQELGTRDTLSQLIHTATSIPYQFLKSEHRINFELRELLGMFTVAQKMSWASRRQTTRIEDQAYSLLGIFDVHIPLLYGEGKRAFRRLQLEIINESNDSSLFAWQNKDRSYSGLLADHPGLFEGCGSVVAQPPRRTITQGFGSWVSPENPAYEIVKKCVRIRMPVLHLTEPQFLKTSLATQIYQQLKLWGPEIRHGKFCLVALGCTTEDRNIFLLVHQSFQGSYFRRWSSPLMAGSSLREVMGSMQDSPLYVALDSEPESASGGVQDPAGVDVAIEFQGSGLRLAGCSDFSLGNNGIWDCPDSGLEDLGVRVLELQGTGYVLLAEDTAAPSFEVRIDFALTIENNVNHAC